MSVRRIHVIYHSNKDNSFFNVNMDIKSSEGNKDLTNKESIEDTKDGDDGNVPSNDGPKPKPYYKGIKYMLDKDLKDLLQEIFGIRKNNLNHKLLQALAYQSNTKWKSFRQGQPEAIELLSKKADR